VGKTPTLLKAYKDLMVALEDKKEREAALNEAQETLSTMGSKVSRAEEDAQVARKALERAKEEDVLAEEVATKAARYKGVATELDKEKRLVESDLVAVQNAYHRIKEEHLKSEIARGATEEAGKKAHDDLEVERTRSRGLSDDVDRVKRMLREKEEALL